MDLRISRNGNIDYDVMLPGSKSLSNRALLIMALCGNTGITGLAMCDDTDVMTRALGSDAREINVGAAGTAMRFLTAYYAAQPGSTVVIDGSERMRCRPVAVLADALRELGARIEYLGNEGFPPLRITGTQLTPKHLRLRGDVSSQYISALMMIAPQIGGLQIELTGNVVSRPYIDMTASLMNEMCADVTVSGNVITIDDAPYHWHHYNVEADWSAASYWFGIKALMPQANLRLHGLSAVSIQGDSRLLTTMPGLGVKGEFMAGVLHLHNCPLCSCSSFIDVTATPDLAQTLAVTMCLLERPFRMTGLSTLRIKETDRIEALRAELLKLGYVIEVEGDEAIGWHGRKTLPQAVPEIHTYNDHRMAMSFALAAIRHPGLIIRDAQVVAKSYPQFWQHMAEAGFNVETINENQPKL